MQSRQWNRLDNAAKIFPAACDRTDTQVFRFACELARTVDAQTLQTALDRTLNVFTLYRRTLKRGLFWYYLEESGLKAVVREEHRPICAPLYYKNRKQLLFEVTHYQNRVNLEVHHVLSDGTGAMEFLKHLVTEYLCLRLHMEPPAPNYDASPDQMADDGFLRHYTAEKKHGKKQRVAAYKLRGMRLPDTRLGVITAYLPVKAVLNEAHKCGGTMTAYLTAVLMEAIGENMTARERRRPVVICVPVNLRQYFPSKTLRNFFSALYVGHDFSQEADFAQIVAEAGDTIRQMLTQDYLSDIINGYSDIEHNFFAKITPLRLKDPVLRIAYKNARILSTAGFSNLGWVALPEALAPHVKAFSVLSGTDSLQMCACSFGDTLTIGMTSPFVSREVQRRFLRKLTDAGIDVEITANLALDEEVDAP